MQSKQGRRKLQGELCKRTNGNPQKGHESEASSAERVENSGGTRFATCEIQTCAKLSMRQGIAIALKRESITGEPHDGV